MSAIARAPLLAALGLGLAARAADDVGPAKAAVPAEVIAECAPAVAERGAIVRCSVRLASRARFVLARRTAAAEGHTTAEEAPEEKRKLRSHAWSGPAIADTSVTFELRAGKKRLTAKTSFRVRPRRVARLTLSDEPAAWTWGTDERLGYPPSFEPATAIEARQRPLWLSDLSGPDAGWALVNEGPNRNWYYIDRLPATPLRTRVWISRALRPDDPFFAAQHADLSLPIASERPHCRRFDLAALRQRLLQREGALDGDPQSRTKSLKRALATSVDVNAELESLHGHLSDFTPPNELFATRLIQLQNDLMQLVTSQADAERAAFPLACSLRAPRPQAGTQP